MVMSFVAEDPNKEGQAYSADEADAGSDSGLMPRVPLKRAIDKLECVKKGRLGAEPACEEQLKKCDCLPWRQGHVVKETIVTLKALMSCIRQNSRTAPGL